MKKTGLVAASMAAASATALSGVSTSIKTNVPLEDGASGKKKDEKSASKTSSNYPDKFAPRFDGLRFIETLVTAHR